MGDVRPEYTKVSMTVLKEQVDFMERNHINKSALSRKLIDKYLRDGSRGNIFKGGETRKLSVVLRKDQVKILEERLVEKSELMKDLIFEWMKEQGL